MVKGVRGAESVSQSEASYSANLRGHIGCLASPINLFGTRIFPSHLQSDKNFSQRSLASHPHCAAPGANGWSTAFERTSAARETFQFTKGG